MAKSPIDKVVAVTGSARGIGLATVRKLVADGARVAIGDVDPAALDAIRGEFAGDAFIGEVDVTDRMSFSGWLDGAEKALGPVDVLVNNAGMMPTGALVDEPDELTRREFDLNVHGVIIGMKLALERMLVRGSGGQVVNVASMAGLVPAAGLVTYTGTKHAVVGMTEAAHYEYADRGITFTCVMPSFVNTGLTSGMKAAPGVPVLEPEDVAEAIVGAVRRPRALVHCPPTIQWAPMLRPFLPMTARTALGRLFNLDTVFLDYDKDARRSYTERIGQ
jgi:NAD(P)-dependent dehydrogenase (short-subunit alcohol dehydrogenase family)